MTDSMFLCDCMYKWINKWKSNGWRNSKGNIVANKYMLEELDSRIKAMDSVKFVCYYQFHFTILQPSEKFIIGPRQTDVFMF